jgi:hypothetical protein
METHLSKTVQLAREAGWKDLRDYDSEMRDDFFMGNIDSLKAFEALVRADEREIVMNEPLTKANWQRFEDEIRADERDRAMRENAYVQAEREACAKVCDAWQEWGADGALLAKAIRNRGNT